MHYERMTRNSVLAATALACLAACTSQSKVDVTSGGGTVQTKPRSEPIFYNGQHYNVNYTYNSSLGLFEMKVKPVIPTEATVRERRPTCGGASSRSRLC